MNAKQYVKISAGIFLMIALLHAIRISCGWGIMVGSLSISTGPSWLVAGFATLLGLIGMCISAKMEPKKVAAKKPVVEKKPVFPKKEEK